MLSGLPSSIGINSWRFQLIYVYLTGDAISNYLLNIRAACRGRGVAAVRFPPIFIHDHVSQIRLFGLINNVAPQVLRIHLQMLDFLAGTNQTQSAPENAGTKQLAHATW
jgi:hypothetical protein